MYDKLHKPKDNECVIIRNNNNNNNTQIAAIALPPSTTHPQLWAELLTFKPKCTINVL